jgi:hypothetical protein
MRRLALELEELAKARKLVTESAGSVLASVLTRHLDALRNRLRVDLRQLRELPTLGRPPANEHRLRLALLDAVLAARVGWGATRRQRSLANALGCSEHAIRRARTKYARTTANAVKQGGYELRQLTARALRAFTPVQRTRYRKLLSLRTK